ncbi:unnamed protein product, partial [Polarella glacialis]
HRGWSSRDQSVARPPTISRQPSHRGHFTRNGRLFQGSCLVSPSAVASAASCAAAGLRRGAGRKQQVGRRPSWLLRRGLIAEDTCDDDSVTSVLLELPADLDAFKGALARACRNVPQVDALAKELLHWRSALLSGRLPPNNLETDDVAPSSYSNSNNNNNNNNDNNNNNNNFNKGSSSSFAGWPPEPLAEELRQVFRQLDLPQLLSEQPELVDSALLNVFEVVERWQAAQRAAAELQLAENGEEDQRPEEQGSFFLPGLQVPAGSSSNNNSNNNSNDNNDNNNDNNDNNNTNDNNTNNNGESNGDGLPERTESDATDFEGSQGPDPAPKGENEGMSDAATDEIRVALDDALQASAADAQKLADEFRQDWQVFSDEARRPQLTTWDASSPPQEVTSNSSGTAAMPAPSAAEQASGAATSSVASARGLPGDFAGTWSSREHRGWQHLVVLRKLLERLPELTELVRKMGRRAGPDSPLRWEQAQRARRRAASGVVRSPLVPAETTGITRSDGSLPMLPSELSLLALANAQPERPGAAGARALHRLRRAEATLLSYERSAWLEEEAITLRWREFRPAVERGPLIVCLDTSKSMAGRREAVAKAALLEVLRQAELEQRPCHLCAFSGPSELQEIEVPPAPVPADAWEAVLAFLAASFGGGTDLEAPLSASLRRVSEDAKWGPADILLVTDGEVGLPPQHVLEELERLRLERGLRLFGLEISESQGLGEVVLKSEILQDLCDEVVRFEALGRISLRWRPDD